MVKKYGGIDRPDKLWIQGRIQSLEKGGHLAEKKLKSKKKKKKKKKKRSQQ